MDWNAGIETALMTVEGLDGPPSLEEAAAQLGIAAEAIDPSFGVVAIDPENGLYAVRVAAAALGDDFDPDKGPFSDPKIAPMR